MLSQSQSQHRSSTSLLLTAPLPRELAARLEAEAEGLVQHHVRAYEAHVYQQRREELRDPKLWARVQSSKKGSFRVYRRVRRAPSAAQQHKPAAPRPVAAVRMPPPLLGSSGSSGSSGASSASTQQQQAFASAALPTQLLGVGFTIGSIDDMLFGSSALTTAAIKIQSLYAQDPIVDAAVLATLLAPSASDPLRSVTLKWVLKKPKMYGVTRHRDYVFIESIGVRRGSVYGERIGYHLMHSVDLPSVPVLDDQSDIVRRRLSSCYLYRSIGSGLLECFLRASTDPWRSTPEPLVVYAAATRLLHCCPGFMRVAETNKLIYALQQNALLWPTEHRTTARRLEDPTSCTMCLKTIGLCKRGYPCQLCDQMCCSSCLVVWKTSFALTVLGGGNILQKRLRFCRSCIISAQSVNPLQIAASRLR